FSSRRRHTRSKRDWSSDVCSSDLPACTHALLEAGIRAVRYATGDPLHGGGAQELRQAGLDVQHLPEFSADAAELNRAWLTSVRLDRKSTRLNSSHVSISYAVFCLK